MISPGTIGSVGCRLHSGNPGTESPLGHGPKARPRQEIKRPERFAFTLRSRSVTASRPLSSGDRGLSAWRL
jgi:hypothetical protein